jgi:cytoskeletal protein CcmA (bactofilin family)
MRGVPGLLPVVLVPLLLAALALAAGPARCETRLSDSVVVSQGLDDDLYAVGGEVRIEDSVSGAALIAAGNALIAGDVEGDAMVAAGQIEVAGGVGDDLRAAGGNVKITGFVIDQAAIAGGTVTLAGGSAIGGRTWIAAGDVRIDGQIGDSLRVAAGKVAISGQVAGNVEVAAREIRVERGAIIGGDLIWRSSQPPIIAEDAQVLGEVRAAGSGDAHGPDDEHDSGSRYDGALALGITIIVAALILLWFAPQLVARSTAVFAAAPVRTVLLGAASAALTPILAVVLFATVLGWLLGLVVMAGYVFGLMLSGLVGLLVIAQLLRNRFIPEAAGWRNALLLAAVVMALIAAQQVPVLGGLLSLILVLGGLGALTALVTGRGPAGR